MGMTDKEAAAMGRQVVESGYNDWLAGKIRARAINWFTSASDDEARLKAQTMHQLADEVLDIISRR